MKSVPQLALTTSCSSVGNGVGSSKDSYRSFGEIVFVLGHRVTLGKGSTLHGMVRRGFRCGDICVDNRHSGKTQRLEFPALQNVCLLGILKCFCKSMTSPGNQILI